MKSKVINKEKRDWNLNAQFYAKIADSPYQKFFDQKIWENYNVLPKSPVLEIGAGVGNFARFLKNPFFTDFSPTMIDIAKKKIKGKGVVCSAHQLPFEERKFKTVFINDTLHHLKGQGILKQSLKEINRVTHQQAYLCLTDRAPNLLGNSSALFFTFLKRIASKFLGQKPGCGTKTEPSFTKSDYEQLRKNWRFEKIVYWRTLLAYFLTVFTHQLAQLGNWDACFKIQQKTLGLVKFLEKHFAWPFFCTEVSIKAQKIGK